MKSIFFQFSVIVLTSTPAFCCQLPKEINPFIYENGNVELNVQEIWNNCPSDSSKSYSFHFKSGDGDFDQVEVSQDLQTIPLHVSCCDSLTWFLETENGNSSLESYPSLGFNPNITDVNSDNVTVQWDNYDSCCFDGVNIIITEQEPHFVSSDTNFAVLNVTSCKEVNINFEMTFNGSRKGEKAEISFTANPSKENFQFDFNGTVMSFNHSILSSCRSVDVVEYYADASENPFNGVKHFPLLTATFQEFSSEDELTLDINDDEQVNFKTFFEQGVLCKKNPLKIKAQVKRVDRRGSHPITLMDQSSFPDSLGRPQCEDISDIDGDKYPYEIAESYNNNNEPENDEYSTVSTTEAENGSSTPILPNSTTDIHPRIIEKNALEHLLKPDGNPVHSIEKHKDSTEKLNEEKTDSRKESAIVGLALFGVVLFIFLTALSAILIKSKVRKMKTSDLTPAWEANTNIDLDETRSNKARLQEGLLAPPNQADTKVDLGTDQTSVQTLDVADLENDKKLDEIKEPPEFTEIPLETPNENLPNITEKL